MIGNTIVTEEEKEFIDEHLYAAKLTAALAQGKVFNPQDHYDNTHGSLYKIAKQRGWDSYQFDLIKRIDRAYKKGKFEEDLNKTADLIKIWKDEML